MMSTRRQKNQHFCLFPLCLLLLQLNFQPTTSRSWIETIDQSKLQNDGMPRVPPPDHETLSHEYEAMHPMEQPHHTNANTNMNMNNMAHQIEIEIHGSTTTLFTEVDVFRITNEPSSIPSATPSSTPSTNPSTTPTPIPSTNPTTTFPPTIHPTSAPSKHPTSSPTFSTARIPRNPKSGYFNYDTSSSSSYGPNAWKNINTVRSSDPGYFWHTFELEDSQDIENDCGSGKKQSPVDVCVKPRESCTETHEMRPKSGDYKMDGEFITKQILSNKLRLILAPRTGEEPDPPQIDFSSNGRGIIDMTNIDFKFPSEHTVCGHTFDGEMQYFTYHPARKRFVAVSFFLDASEGNPKNEHMQEVIDAFKIEYEEDERKCKEKQQTAASNSFASAFASTGRNNGGGRHLHNNDESEQYQYDDWMWNATIPEENDSERGQSSLRSKQNSQSSQRQQQRQRRRLALKWHPFHPDIQKTVHFWGYTGSFTEPPCTRDSVDWKIMDVPTPISPRQLAQLRHLLFTHVDGGCSRTSVHNPEGSVARPTQAQQKYYKCTRDDYVSDEERAVCGDGGCVENPFGSGLNRYYPPLVHVTGPPTRSPSK